MLEPLPVFAVGCEENRELLQKAVASTMELLLLSVRSISVVALRVRPTPLMLMLPTSETYFQANALAYELIETHGPYFLTTNPT